MPWAWACLSGSPQPTSRTGHNMTTSLMPEPRQRYFDSNGQPLAGGLVYTYAAGTNTPKATFTDSAGTTPSSNPVVLDVNGEALIYWSGAYKVNVTSSIGVQIAGYPVDNFISIDSIVTSIFNGPSGAGLVGFDYSSTSYPVDSIGKWLQDLAKEAGATFIGWIRSSTGAVATTIQKWMGWNRVFLFDFLTDAQIADAQAGIKNNLTVQIQKALNASVGRILVVNSGLFGVDFSQGANGLSLDIPSNITIEFEPNASFEAMPHNATIYQMMRVWDRNNVTIIRPSLNGRRDLNSAVTGEFGMGIDIRGGSNIHVVSPITINTWGDGIYLGLGIGATPVADRVTIDRPFADGCRRQGMSIVCGNVVVNDPVWQNISGTAPAAGLDIEPDSNSDELQKIVIRNPKTFNCTTGIQIQFANFAGAIPKNIDIQIINPIDNGSVVGCSVNGANTSGGVNKLIGKIVIQDPQWINNGQAAFFMSEYDALGPDVFVIRPVVVDPNRTAQSSPRYGSPFSLLRDTGSAFTYAMGGLHIEEPSVILNSGAIPRLFSFQDVVNGISKVVDCHFIDPVNLLGVSDVRGNFQGSGTVSDRFGVWNYQLLGSSTIDFNYTATVIAVNASSLLTLDGVSSFVAGSPDIMIRNSASSCIVATAAGGNFVGSAVGIRLQSPLGNAGSYVRLRPLGSNIFLIMEKYGTWNLI